MTEKNYSHSRNGSQKQGCGKFDSSFSWGSPSSQGGTTPKYNEIGNNFYTIWPGHVVFNSLKIIWIFNMASSRNVDLTWKEHSRQQVFWTFQLSPLKGSSRFPRSRDNLFSHSMSKASPPRGQDLWYLTVYENKVLIYQTTISNSL